LPLLGEIASLATAFLWSGSSIAFTAASVRAGSVVVNITRMVFAAVLLLITILIAGISLNLSVNQYLNLALSGFLGLVFGDSFLFKAFKHIGARLSMLIMSLTPAISALLAYWFLQEVLSTFGIIGITVTIAGIALVTTQRKESPEGRYHISRSGIFYAFLGAAGQAGGFIFAKLAFNEGEVNSFAATFIRIAVSVLIFYPLLAMTKKYRHPFKMLKSHDKALTFTLIGTVLGPYLGITMSLVAIANTYVGIASTIMASVPILMLPLVRYYYKEKLNWKSVLGAFIAFGGIAILFLK